MPTPTTSQRSLRSLCEEADPDFNKERLQPVVWVLSNGRTFKDKPNPYSTP